MIDWKNPLVELPQEDVAIVWIFDPEIKMSVQPAVWYKNHQHFAAQGGWFEIDEVIAWGYAVIPEPPDVEKMVK